MDKLLKKLIWPIVLVPPVYAAIIWDRLPETVPVHYNFYGKADTYGTKDDLIVIIMVLTIASIISYAFMTWGYRMDPKKSAGTTKDRLVRIGFVCGVAVSALNYLIIYTSGHNTPGLFAQVLAIIVGVLFCFTGNYMFTIKPYYPLGFRSLWTHRSEDNWRKTHLLGGNLFFYAGILVLILSFTIPKTWLIPILIFFTIAISVIISIYSFLLHRKEKKHGQVDEKTYE